MGARDELHGHDPGPLPPQPELFSLYEVEPGGERPDQLFAVSGPQARVQRRTVQQIVDFAHLPLSMILRRRWWNSCQTSSISFVLSRLILSRLSKCPRSCLWTSLCELRFASRSWWNSWWKCRRSYPSPMIALLHALLAQRIAEQNVDIPVVGGSGTGGGLSGFLPGQHYSMTAEQIVDNPVLRRSFSGDLQGFSPGQSSSKRTANKIADIPDPSGGIHDFPQTLHRAGGSSDLPDEANQWVFSTFPRFKKSAKIPRTQRSELGAQSSSWTPRP